MDVVFRLFSDLVVQRHPPTSNLPLSHGGNTGSNPVGDARNISNLITLANLPVQNLSNVQAWTRLVARRPRLSNLQSRRALLGSGKLEQRGFGEIAADEL